MASAPGLYSLHFITCIRCWCALILGLCCALSSFAAQAQNYSDIWWNPAESGWGLTLADHDTQLFGVWYTYDAKGKPTWYMIPGGSFTQDKRFFAGDIYQTTGPANGAAFDPSLVTVTKVGSASLDFAPPGLAAGTAMFSYTIGSLTQSKPVQRQRFGSAAPNWGVDSTDLWWNPYESGWGLSLAQHGNDTFGVWFNYDAAGKPQWFVIPDAAIDGYAVSGMLYSTTGPPMGVLPFDPSLLALTPVGQASFSIYGNEGIFSHEINGPWLGKAMTRLPFGSPALPSCGPPAAATVPAVLTVSPIDQNDILWISPIGNLNPSQGHTLATDHMYLYFANPDAGGKPSDHVIPVVAPADGVVTFVTGGDPEVGVYVSVSPAIQYTLGHLIPSIPITVGMRLTAGQVLGTTGLAFALDLGIMNTGVTQSFLNPSRYIVNTLNADSPLKYFAEPLRSQMYGKVQRIGPDCDGKINYDIAGRLAGNWFLGSAVLAFIQDTYDPTQVRISVPLGIKPGIQGGVMSIAATDPDPATVTPASGKVLYTLTLSRTGPPIVTYVLGSLLVQMLDDTHLQMEVFSTTDSATGFTSSSRIFTR